MGRKIVTAPSMMASVSLLDEASHTVRLMSGWLDENSRNGNSAAPAVAMVQTGTSALIRNAASGRARSAAASTADRKAANGRSHNAGRSSKFISHAPGTMAVTFTNGLDGPFMSI